MEYAKDVDIVVELEGIRLALRAGHWHPDPAPESSDWRREAQARAFGLSVKALPSLGYTPDPVQSLAEQVRQVLGATVIYVRPELTLEEQGLYEDEDGNVRDTEDGGLIVF